MPDSYGHLRIRLDMEQTRFLHWGGKVGILEEESTEYSQVLRLHRNLILDILFEMQELFKEVLHIQEEYDHMVPDRSYVRVEPDKERFGGQFLHVDSAALMRKALKMVEKAGNKKRQVKWALVKQDRFEEMIRKLIGFNEAIESLLHTSDVRHLKGLQQQTFMSTLQLSSQIEELKQISLAIQLQTSPVMRPINNENPSYPMADGQGKSDNQTLSKLAEFKAEELCTEEYSVVEMPVGLSDVMIKSEGIDRSEANFRGEAVWIEWKEDHSEYFTFPDWQFAIEGRVRKLVGLLRSSQKPEQFRAPHCLGYLIDEKYERCRFGFIYRKPDGVPPEVEPVSLLDLFTERGVPSLNQRVTLAHELSRCVLYLHSVNWLHKGLRSDNVVFFASPGGSHTLLSPIIGGFDYARLDLKEEVTEPPPNHLEHDIYRHSNIVKRRQCRSNKAHDIFSLGIILIEIAHWKSIKEIIRLPNLAQCGSWEALKYREHWLKNDCAESVRSHVGEAYEKAVSRCLVGLATPTIDPLSVEYRYHGQDSRLEADAAVTLQKGFIEDVVDTLGDIKL